MSIDTPKERTLRTEENKSSREGGSRSRMASDQSSRSGFNMSANSAENSTQTPDTSYASIDSLKSIANPSSASPPASARRQKSTVPEPVPPLPIQKEPPPPPPPKSILATRSSSSLNKSPPHTIHRSPSIQFAPLPDLAPRRRKSSVPLGIAARGQMMQKRRVLLYGPSVPSTLNDSNQSKQTSETYSADGGGMWTQEEAEAHMARQLRIKQKEREKMLKRQQKELEREAARNNPNGGQQSEDPFILIGRKMKDAWKRVGKKDRGKISADPQTRTQVEAETVSDANANTARTGPSPLPENPESGLQLHKQPKETHADDPLYSSESLDLAVRERELAKEETPGGRGEREHDDNDETEIDIDADPNEVDVTKIIPLRSGSPPPSLPSESSDDTDAEAADADTIDSDSLSATTPSEEVPSSVDTPKAHEFTSFFPSSKLEPSSPTYTVKEDM